MYLGSFSQNAMGLSSAFVQNKGQIINQDNERNNDVLFMYTGKGLKIQLRKTGYSYELFSSPNIPKIKPGKKTYDRPEELRDIKTFTSRVDIDFYKMGPSVEVITSGKKTEVLNYITCGKEISNVNLFEKITYKNIYKNIDVEFTLTGNDINPLKYNVILHPGADIDQIKFLCKGANSIEKSQNKIRIKTAIGEITEKIPFSFYTDQPSQNHEVNFKLEKNIISFAGTYDQSKTLVIDPSSNIIWGTYFGGSSLEYCAGTGVDSQNNSYLTGHTLSSSNIATNGVHQTTLSGNFDVFLAKFNPNGALIWGTYFGGNNYETAYCILVEPNGNVYVGGNSGSTSNVASAGAHQTVYGGGIDDAILIKFNTNGQRIWSTYYGADLHDITFGIALDGAGNVLICGHTESNNIANAIATPGAYNTALSFGVDAFLAKFTAAGVRLWGSYYGETGVEEAWGIAADASNNVIITGFTNSLANIATPTSHQPFCAGSVDAFVAKLDPTGSTLIWGTYYGGVADEQGAVVLINAAGNIFVGGNAGSGNGISTPGCYQAIPGSAEDVFLLCLNSNGVRQWGSYYGGDGSDYIYGIITDPQSNLLICGQTLSTNSISTASAYQPSIGLVNTYDAYFAKFKNTGDSLVLGSYYGSSGNDAGKGIALDNTGKLYVAGETNSPSGLTTPGTHMPNAGGSGDAFLGKFCLTPEPFIIPVSVPTLCINDTYTLTASVGYSTYFWSNGFLGNPQVIGPLTTGTYYYKVTVNDVFGCSGTSADSAKVVVSSCITGIKEITENPEVKIFPVPADNFIFIENPLQNGKENYKVEIFSSTGQLISENELKGPENKVDVSSLPPGIYFLKYSSEQNILIKKFLKK